MFDLNKAIKCIEKMKTYFKTREEVSNVQIPENIKLGTNEYLIYIFYSCLLDYGMRSKIYQTNLTNTYKKYKNIFNPKYVVENYIEKEIDLLNIIKENIHPRYPNVAVKKWITLSKFLYVNYPNEKLKEKIMSLKSYKELYTFITSIHGYGQKNRRIITSIDL